MTEISILIAVYNAENKIMKTINSIKNQTFKNFECIIVDDGSTDNTLNILKKINDKRFKILESSHNGLTKSLNIGLSNACGKYLSRIDADDIFMSNKLEVQKKFMDNNPDVVLLSNDIDLIDKKENKLKTFKYPDKHNEIMKMLEKRMNSLPHSSLFIRNKILQEIGGYREEFYKAQDYDLILRILDYGDISNIPHVLSLQRSDEKSITYDLSSNSQVEYSVLALASYYLRKLNKTDLISDRHFINEYKVWYESSVYKKTFKSRISRNKMKRYWKSKSMHLFSTELIKSFFYDIIWPIRPFLGYNAEIKKWIENNF